MKDGINQRDGEVMGASPKYDVEGKFPNSY